MSFLNGDEVLAGLRRGAEKFGSSAAGRVIKQMARRLNAPENGFSPKEPEPYGLGMGGAETEQETRVNGDGHELLPSSSGPTYAKAHCPQTRDPEVLQLKDGKWICAGCGKALTPKEELGNDLKNEDSSALGYQSAQRTTTAQRSELQSKCLSCGHEDPLPWDGKCRGCGMENADDVGSRGITKDDVVKENSDECELCGQGGQLVQMYDKSIDGLVQVCKKCEGEPESQSGLRHVRKNSWETYFCPMCKEPTVNEANGKLECDICGDSFSKSSSLKKATPSDVERAAHRTHENAGPDDIHCQDCSFQTTSQAEADAHEAEERHQMNERVNASENDIEKEWDSMGSKNRALLLQDLGISANPDSFYRGLPQSVKVALKQYYMLLGNSRSNSTNDFKAEWDSTSSSTRAMILKKFGTPDMLQWANGPWEETTPEIKAAFSKAWAPHVHKNADPKCDRCGAIAKDGLGLWQTEKGEHICDACKKQGKESGIAQKWNAGHLGPESWELASIDERCQWLEEAGQDINYATCHWTDLSLDVHVALQDAYDMPVSRNNAMDSRDWDATSPADREFDLKKAGFPISLAKMGWNELSEKVRAAISSMYDYENSGDPEAACHECHYLYEQFDQTKTCPECGTKRTLDNASGKLPTFIFADSNGEEEQFTAKDEAAAWEAMSKDFGTPVAEIKKMGIRFVRKVENSIQNIADASGNVLVCPSCKSTKLVTYLGDSYECVACGDGAWSRDELSKMKSFKNGLAPSSKKKCPTCDGPVTPTEGVSGSNSQYTCRRCGQDFDETELVNSVTLGKYRSFSMEQVSATHFVAKDSLGNIASASDADELKKAVDECIQYNGLKNADPKTSCEECGITSGVRDMSDAWSGGGVYCKKCWDSFCEGEVSKSEANKTWGYGHPIKNAIGEHMSGADCSCTHSASLHYDTGHGDACSKCGCEVYDPVVRCQRCGDKERQGLVVGGLCESCQSKRTNDADVEEIERHVEGIEHELSEIEGGTHRACEECGAILPGDSLICRECYAEGNLPGMENEMKNASCDQCGGPGAKKIDVPGEPTICKKCLLEEGGTEKIWREGGSYMDKKNSVGLGGLGLEKGSKKYGATSK